MSAFHRLKAPKEVEMASVTESGSNGNTCTAVRSLPVGVERGLGGVTVAKSYQSTSEMSEFASSLQQSSTIVDRDLETSADEYEVVQTEEASITRSAEHQPSYGAIGKPERRRHRRRRRRKKSTSVVSITRLFEGSYQRLEEEGSGREEEEEEESEDEGPPIIELIYRRSCKDKTKLIVIPVLYFAFMVMAGVFAFYTIEALLESYEKPVRSVKYISVNEYHPIGIAFFPENFSTYTGCEYTYNDDLAPFHGNWSEIIPGGVPKCTYVNVTFYSLLIHENRTTMVFRGPTRVQLKESLAVRFNVSTLARKYSAVEYLLLEDWNSVYNKTLAEQQQYLQNMEVMMPLHTVPAGFRTWVKMYYIVRSINTKNTENLSDFEITADFSKYNDFRNVSDRTTDVVYALFEWKSNTYEFITEILSTNIFNTVGSLAGVFVTLIKGGEYCKAWINRLRRERRKKLIKLQELQEQQQRLMEEYEQKKEEKKEDKRTRRVLKESDA